MDNLILVLEIIVIVLVLLVICGFLALVYFPRNLYIGGDWGFIDSRRSEPPVHRVSQAQLFEILELLLGKEDFDLLWLSKLKDEYSGVTIMLQDGQAVLSVSFKLVAEAEKIADFRAYLKANAFMAKERSNGFNGGLGANFREVDFKIELEDSAEHAMAAIEFVLAKLQPIVSDAYYVKASRLSDYGKGIKFSTSSDPLGSYPSV